MPNGGSDCCGTCWFNSKNGGEPGFLASKKEGIVTCVIRDIEIDNPFWTYCSNHPHHNPDKIDVPISPVYIDKNGYREIWKNIDDNETTRLALLKLLDAIQEKPITEYPAGNGLDEEIIMQINFLDEKRAIPKLKQILKFNPLSEPEKQNVFGRNRIITIGLAIETYAKLTGNAGLDEIEKFVEIGITKSNKKYNTQDDKFSPIRYHAIRGLQYCDDDKSIDLLKKGLIDPHDEIKAFAKEILEQKISVDEIQKFLDEFKIYENSKPNWWEFWKMNKK